MKSSPQGSAQEASQGHRQALGLQSLLQQTLRSLAPPGQAALRIQRAQPCFLDLEVWLPAVATVTQTGAARTTPLSSIKWCPHKGARSCVHMGVRFA